jgi:ABC-2 type transport system ATP-binding protein
LRFLNDLRGRKATWNGVRQLCDRLGLDLGIVIKNLSKGNKQKIGVVQALMHRPELLLLDEPTSGLDPLVQQEVLELVREARKHGATVFFSSHILSEVQAIADRVAIIRDGQIVEVAKTSTLTHRALHRITVRFKPPVDYGSLVNLPGVELLERQDGSQVTLQVAGEMDALVKALGAYPISDLSTESVSLEQIFLTYYGAGRPAQEVD